VTLGATRQLHLIDGMVGDPAIGHMYRSQLAGRAVAQYPRAGRVLPTRLGNALRRGEDSAGSQYRLDLMQIAPHLLSCANKQCADYVNDVRHSMDP
jgi:hypothetical protein